MIFRAQAAYRADTPGKNEIEAMIRTCKELEKPMEEISEDTKEFGLLTEDTFCYTAPVSPSGTPIQVPIKSNLTGQKFVEMLRTISYYARDCTRDLTADEEAELNMEVGPMNLALYEFISEYRRILKFLVDQQGTLKTTGSLYTSIGKCLRTQATVLQVRTPSPPRWDGKPLVDR
jgi:hypothetical protein